MEDMEETLAGPDKRHFEELEDCSSKESSHPVRKYVRPNEEDSMAAILAAINTLATRFDKQEKQLGDIKAQIKENTIMIGSLAKVQCSRTQRM